MIRTAAIFLGLTALILSDTASAQKGVPGEWAQTKSGIYKVGDYNAELSRLCRQGIFRQRKLLRLSIGYLGDKGYGITGIAQQGYNLYDPTGASEPNRTYHFYSQGYSNCRVYVAVTPPPRQPQQ
jgi:hypothetical protein